MRRYLRASGKENLLLLFPELLTKPPYPVGSGGECSSPGKGSHLEMVWEDPQQCEGQGNKAEILKKETFSALDQTKRDLEVSVT